MLNHSRPRVAAPIAAAAPRKLSPTQDLILETLSSRFREGFEEFTLSRTHMKALNGLVERKLVTVRDHNASPNDVYVRMTEKAKLEWLMPGFVSPRDRERSESDHRSIYSQLHQIIDDAAETVSLRAAVASLTAELASVRAELDNRA
mgnify:CR=1 FL=1|tara:strand:+ start:1147 stop:1587 length:441 start_codon:yes stop_codon:yes gene_type:complete